MPRTRPESSTVRRRNLANFITSFGQVLARPCSRCRNASLECKAHARSNKCAECLRRGQSCDLTISKSQFDRLLREKNRLTQALQAAYDAQEKAREELRVAFAREMDLRRQIDSINEHASEAIAVETNNLEVLPADNARAIPPTLNYEQMFAEGAENLSSTNCGTATSVPDDYFGGFRDDGFSVDQLLEVVDLAGQSRYM